MRLAQLVRRCAADQRGTTSIEYGLIATLIAIVAIAAMKNVGSRVKLTFGDVGNNLSSY